MEQWLSKQPAYTLHRDIKVHFPRRKVVVRGNHIQYQADLIDYQKLWHQNNGTRYLLTVIDCFSRLATAIPLKRKFAAGMPPALDQAFKKLGGAPLKLQTDDGGEFWNHQVLHFLKKHNVHLFSTKSGLKASIVERFNRTLKEIIRKYLTANKTQRYLPALDDILEGYNSRKHSGLKYKYAPNEVNDKNVGKVFEIQFRDYLNATVKARKFKIGDVVRLASYRAQFYKKTSRHNFSPELYIITDCLNTNPPSYRIKEKDTSEAVEGTFYEAQLQIVGSDNE